MSAPSSTAMLDDRYGRTPSRRRRVWWIVFGVLAAVLVGYVAWTTVARTSDSVDFSTTGFHSVDDHSVTVQFQVTARPDTALACVVEAQDTEHGIVGWRVVQYPADPAHTRTFEEQIPTTAPATTGLVTSCWIP